MSAFTRVFDALWRHPGSALEAWSIGRCTQATARRDAAREPDTSHIRKSIRAGSPGFRFAHPGYLLLRRDDWFRKLQPILRLRSDLAVEVDKFPTGTTQLRLFLALIQCDSGKLLARSEYRRSGVSPALQY
jgi:hypothetical protein